MSKIFYLHVGYPKTGTTTLQQKVFPNLGKKIIFVGKINGFKNGEYVLEPQNNKLFLELRQLSWSGLKDKPIAKGTFYNLIKNYYPDNSDQDIFMSDENFVTFSLIPDLFDGKLRMMSLNDRINRLKEIVEDSGYTLKILMNVRNQSSFIHSFYAEFNSKIRDRLRIKKYKNFLEYLFSENNKEICSSLNYSNTAIKMMELVGHENFLLIPYELMESESKLYLDLIYDFCSVQIANRNYELLAHKENVRQTEKGKLIRKEPFLLNLKTKLGLGKVSFMGLGKYFLWLKTRNKYIQQDAMLENIIKENFYSSNKDLVEMYPQFPVFQSYINK